MSQLMHQVAKVLEFQLHRNLGVPLEWDRCVGKLLGTKLEQEFTECFSGEAVASPWPAQFEHYLSFSLHGALQ